jgi:hypothetical protein
MCYVIHSILNYRNVIITGSILIILEVLKQIGVAILGSLVWFYSMTIIAFLRCETFIFFHYYPPYPKWPLIATLFIQDVLIPC